MLLILPTRFIAIFVNEIEVKKRANSVPKYNIYIKGMSFCDTDLLSVRDLYTLSGLSNYFSSMSGDFRQMLCLPWKKALTSTEVCNLFLHDSVCMSRARSSSIRFVGNAPFHDLYRFVLVVLVAPCVGCLVSHECRYSNFPSCFHDTFYHCHFDRWICNETYIGDAVSCYSWMLLLLLFGLLFNRDKERPMIIRLLTVCSAHGALSLPRKICEFPRLLIGVKRVKRRIWRYRVR